MCIYVSVAIMLLQPLGHYENIFIIICYVPLLLIQMYVCSATQIMFTV